MRKLLLLAAAFAGTLLAARVGLWPLALLAVPLSLLKREGRRLRAAWVCAGLALGLLWPRAYDACFRAPARALEGRTVPLSATVEDWPWATGLGAGLTVRVHPDSGPSFRARLYAGSDALDLAPGDDLAVTAECRPPDRLRGEETDSLTSRGIFLVAYAQGGLASRRPDSVPLRYWPAHWSRALKDALRAHLPQDASGLGLALVTGDKTGLTQTQLVALRRAGLSHTVAVSGLHIGFLAGFVTLLLGRRRRRAAAVALPVLIAFALAVGLGPSVVRAVVMQAFLMLGPLLGRETDPPTSLSAALLLLLLANPYAVGSVSLQLSFAAVAGILALSGRVQTWLLDRVKTRRKPLLAAARFVAATLAVTLGALAFTTPLSALYFGGVSLAAPLSNLLCLPAVAAAFVLCLLSAALGPLGPLAGLLCRYVLGVAAGLSALPFASLPMTGPYYPAALAFIYLLALLFALRKDRRPAVLALCCAASLCAAVVLTRLDYALGPMTLTVLDVGQGQSVVLRLGDRTALVDCGGNAATNAGDAAADYLGGFGVDRLDALVLTHFHDDHANGVPELLERLSVARLYAPPDDGSPLYGEIVDLAREKGVQVVTVAGDTYVPLGPALLTLYAPLGAGEANEAGLSVLCRAETFAALFTGDMDQTVEQRLVKYGCLPHVQLLAAGHHGAKSSTSQALLDAVTPELVVVSSGYNSYGHPNPDTLRRIAGVDADIYRTDLQGNITITVGQ